MLSSGERVTPRRTSPLAGLRGKENTEAGARQGLPDDRAKWNTWGRSGGGVQPRRKVGKRDPCERADHGAGNLVPDFLRDADVGAAARRGAGDALDEAEIPLERGNDLQEVDLGRIALKRVTAVRTAE